MSQSWSLQCLWAQGLGSLHDEPQGPAFEELAASIVFCFPLPLHDSTFLSIHSLSLSASLAQNAILMNVFLAQ